MIVSPAGISAFQQGQLKEQVQFAVMRKGREAAKQQGAGMLKLLEGAANLQKAQVGTGSIEPFKGTAIDLLA
jgi:hypothetical protein